MDIAAALATTVVAFGAGYAAGDRVHAQNDSMEPGKAAAAGIGATTLALTVPVAFAASAIWGYRTANRCATYQAEHAALLGATAFTPSEE